MLYAPEMPARSLDLLGTSEAAAVLNVEPQRLSKWRRLGVVLPDGRRVPFPQPVLVLRATPLWRGRDIRALRDKLAERGLVGGELEAICGDAQ